MKNLLIATSLSLALIASQSALAAPMPPKPAECPGISALQTSTFEMAERDKDGTWFVGVLHNNYDTDDAWTFVMGKIKATGQQDALKKAATGLLSLTYQTGPIAIEQYGLWACGYYTGEGYPAVTVTPALGFAASATLLK